VAASLLNHLPAKSLSLPTSLDGENFGQCAVEVTVMCRIRAGVAGSALAAEVKA